jgi:FkbM family methyltransferase
MMKRFRKEWRNLGRLLRTNSLVSVAGIFVSNRLGRKRAVPVNVHGKSIYIRTSTSDLEVALSSLGKEFSGLRLAYPRSQKGLIVDAGGYIGTAAIALAEMYPEATIVSIEPSRENFELLKRNVAAYQNIFAHNAALAPASETGEVALMSRGTGEWGFTIVEKPQDRPVRFTEKVPVISLERILQEYGSERIMICKMDIEGAEHKLLKQGDWLEKVDILMIELHERIVAGCEKAFEEANRGRFVHPSGGEKMISVGPGYFGPVGCVAGGVR